MFRTPAVTTAAPVKEAKKKTASSKPKKVDHPKYAEMITDALTNLKVRRLFCFEDHILLRMP